MKLWLMWKAHGRNGLMLRIEKAYDHAQYLTELIKNREGFKLVQEVTSSIANIPFCVSSKNAAAF